VRDCCPARNAASILRGDQNKPSAISGKQNAVAAQCGIGGNAMTVDDEIKKLELVVDTAREVWGSS
jgi:hypothetical protein